MKITVPIKVLSKPLALASGAVEHNQTIPILANLLVRMKQGKLSLAGNNVELEVTTTLTDKKIKGEDGECTIAAQRLLDICQALNTEEAVIEMVADNGEVTVHCGRSRYRLQTMPAGEYPEMDKVERWEERLTVPASQLKRLLDMTSFAMASGDARVYLNGLLLEIGEGMLRAVATNGHRLARSQNAVKGGDEKKKRQLILPPKAVHEIRRLLDSVGDAEVTLEAEANHVRVACADEVYVSKLIDARYPDYRAIMGQDLPISLTLETAHFDRALQQACAILTAGDYSESKPIRLLLSKNLLRITATNNQQEEAEVEIPLEYEGDDTEICVNATYIQDYVKAVGEEKVEIHLKDSSVSCVLNAPGDEDTLYFVMPIRI